MLDKAKDKVREILATHQPKPLSDSEEQAVEDILKEARSHFRRKGVISDAEWLVYQGGSSRDE
jgi:hypothetical protein